MSLQAVSFLHTIAGRSIYSWRLCGVTEQYLTCRSILFMRSSIGTSLPYSSIDSSLKTLRMICMLPMKLLVRSTSWSNKMVTQLFMKMQCERHNHHVADWEVCPFFFSLRDVTDKTRSEENTHVDKMNMSYWDIRPGGHLDKWEGLGDIEGQDDLDHQNVVDSSGYNGNCCRIDGTTHRACHKLKWIH